MRCLTVVLIVLLIAGLTACTTKNKEPKSKILCPACGTEFESIFQKRF